MSITTPLVLLIFNRPKHTEQVLAAIAQVKPKRLLVVADGPRAPEESEACERTREVIDRVDWECDVLTNYSKENLGCQVRWLTGLKWVFDMVEEAIVLEDDDIPHPTFFRFCEELLEKYRDDTRVMMINGTNFQFGQLRTSYSYYFSRYSSLWGWASWRRAWRHYDADMTLWPALRETPWLLEILGDPAAAAYYRDIFDRTYEGRINTFGYRWKFALWAQNGLVAIPAVNLVTNIGHGECSTHTTDSTRVTANVPVSEIAFPLRHPPYMFRDRQSDFVFFQTAYARRQSIRQSLRTALCATLSPFDAALGATPNPTGIAQKAWGIGGRQLIAKKSHNWALTTTKC